MKKSKKGKKAIIKFIYRYLPCVFIGRKYPFYPFLFLEATGMIQYYCTDVFMNDVFMNTVLLYNRGVV